MKKPKGESWTPVHTFRPGGAAPFVRVVFQEGEWVALKADGSTGWRFNPDRQEWVDTSPKNFVELIELKKREFEERTGQSLLDYMEPYKGEMIGWRELYDTSGNKLGYVDSVGYGGFVKNNEGGRNYQMNMYLVGTNYINLGCERITLEDVPGSEKGDFAVVMVGARPPDPELGETNIVYMPFIIGVRYQEKWGTANNIWEPRGSNDFFIPVEGLEQPENLEKWINNNIGGLTEITAYLRFQETGDWNGVHVNDDYGLYRDAPLATKRLMEMMGEKSYIQSLTKNPDILFGSDSSLTVERISKLLDTDVDKGFFVDRIWDRRSMSP
jgi:hypothetical protein